MVDNAPLDKVALVKISSQLGCLSEKRGRVYEVYDRNLDSKQINVRRDITQMVVINITFHALLD